MSDTEDNRAGPLGRFIRVFYDARRAGDPESLRRFMADDIRWSEPDVGVHLGELRGRDAVLDMIRRALHATGGTFDLAVASTAETGNHVAASIEWSADKNGRRIEGRELAVFEIRDGRIQSARFHPDNLADDRDFWDQEPPDAS